MLVGRKSRRARSIEIFLRYSAPDLSRSVGAARTEDHRTSNVCIVPNRGCSHPHGAAQTRRVHPSEMAEGCARRGFRPTLNSSIRRLTAGVRRVLSKRGVIDVVHKSVCRSLGHVVVQDPRNQLRFVQCVFFERQEVNKHRFLIWLLIEVGADLLKANVCLECRTLVYVHRGQPLCYPVP